MNSEEMNIVAVIPGRRASTRLIEKPLRDINGKTLIQRVWEQSTKVKGLSAVYIATDDDEIASISRNFGAEVLMTSPEIPSGSARVSAAIRILGVPVDIAINIQGDMPFIEPRVVESAISFFKENYDKFHVVTIAIPIRDLGEFLKPDAVKVVIGEEGQALYFSRAPIPHPRDGDRWEVLPEDDQAFYGLKHIGLYLFRPEALKELDDWSVTPLEKVEKLEQLKLLDRGYKIGVCIVPRELMVRSIEVDTESDLKAAQALAAEQEGR
ncbi:MAG TPA: 3-deoxy-manno-octulosonate cytidylyltransferase [Oligoflexia bacterium]|nr:3-deoxy-manno-octulosonate cytidylyltransferase [Oligoflexia bacterium]HMP49319.1 3-deoxy-manno-octulosonate cytidylyltransferase [Oligoflexia bacterium]